VSLTSSPAREVCLCAESELTLLFPPRSQITQQWERPSDRPEIPASQAASTMPDADGSALLSSLCLDARFQDQR